MAESGLRVVLDTNVLLVSISSRSKYHWIFRALLEERFILLLSNEILTEYEEVVFDLAEGHVPTRHEESPNPTVADRGETFVLLGFTLLNGKGEREIGGYLWQESILKSRRVIFSRTWLRYFMRDRVAKFRSEYEFR